MILKKIKNHIKINCNVVIEPIINETFLQCLDELRDYARKESKDIKSPVVRLMQVEEALKKHLGKNNSHGV